jgi:hypothetical protein
VTSTRVWILVGAVLLAAYVWGDVYLLTVRRGDVQGNLEASYVSGTPAFAALLWRFESWRGKRDRIEQDRHEERMRHLDALHAKVDRLHAHLGIEPTTD